MSVLVAGGAGYIGSQAVQALRAAGEDVIVYDDLSAGHRQAAKLLHAETPLVLLGRLRRADRTIKAGNYEIAAGITLPSWQDAITRYVSERGRVAR